MNQTNKKVAHLNKVISLLLMIGILFIAANLRAPLTSVGPLVSLIRDNLEITNTAAGMITTLPLFAFALFSPLVPKLARKYGIELVLFCSLIFLTLGIVLRSSFGSAGLFLGTAILGLAISVGNVLLPSLIKKEFPHKVGLMTGLYSVSMNVFAALASGISIPLALNLGLGWSGALRVWALLSFLSLLLWIPQLKRLKSNDNNITQDNIEETKKIKEDINLTKSTLAWQVTIYMGLQSLIFYCLVAWLPDILSQYGMNPSKAGWMLSLMQLALIPTTFIVSILAGRRKSQQTLVLVGSTSIILGLILLLLLGNTSIIYLAIILLGIGGGFTFSLSMMFFNLRTNNADEAARLSGMAQSIGYLLAACGPIFFGFLHDKTSGWAIPIVSLICFASICLIMGLGASKDTKINSKV